MGLKRRKEETKQSLFEGDIILKESWHNNIQ